MALTNYSKKCTSCGGNRWEYLKEQKLWRCQYCGAYVERQEQYDGLYSVKNVVRQVILDAAYRKMEQAERNLSECQKIDARYPGTQVAALCCHLLMAVTPNACPAGQDSGSLLGQVKRDYAALTEESRQMTDDETAVYEFLDSSDAWATLATVFDTLGDSERRDYLLTLTDPSQVFCKETNRSLLRFALKNNRLELAKQILANREGVDREDALLTVLRSCPDGTEKGSMAAGLLESGALPVRREETLEQYLSGEDSGPTKAAVALAACRAGFGLNLELLLREVLGGAELPAMRELLDALLTRRLYDGEVEQLLEFAAAQPDAERCMAVLDALREAGQFVVLNSRQIMAFLTASQLSAEERAELPERLENFTADDRAWEAAAGVYLCQAREPERDRSTVLTALLKKCKTVPARDFEQYVLQCSFDGEKKPDRVRQLLALPAMKPAFFRELPGKYLKFAQDSGTLRQEVLHRLLDGGLAIDGAALMDYICVSREPAQDKARLVELAQKNGTVLRSDALSVYLERCPEQFAPGIFALLYRDSCTVSGKALENYVLRCKDDPAVKVLNAKALAARTGMRLGGTACTLQFLGRSLSCSLAQAYILTTSDDIGLATQMLGTMTAEGVRLNADVQDDGKNKKFGKYLNENRNALSPLTVQLCEENRLFSKFFF